MATNDEEPREEVSSSTTETDLPLPQEQPSHTQFKKRAIKGRPTRRRSEDTSYLEVEESVERQSSMFSNRKRKYDRGVPFHMQTHIKSSNETEKVSRFVPHQETEEDRWKLKSGGGLILQFTTTQQESDSSREPKER